MDVIILGAGGHGRVVLDILTQARSHTPIGFLDNNPALHGRRIDGLPVIGDTSRLPDMFRQGVRGAVIAVGDNGIRRGMGNLLERQDIEIVNAIHPSAQLARSVSLGKGVVIAAGVVVCAHCQIGDYAILNSGCIIDHESMVGTAAHVCPGVRLAGHVTIESGVFVGIGATVIQNIHIGYEAVVGAGAVVIRNVDPMTTVVGVPAQVIKDSPSVQHASATLIPANDPRDPMHVALR